MKVVHITARLSEGGAAAVARSIAQTQNAEYGTEATFIYGYGPRGHPSALEGELSALRLADPLVAGTQLAIHRTLGAELPIARAGALRAAREAMRSADLVHIHIAHSYFMSLGWLVKTLVELEKPWVWTLHDQWVFTGRCAQPAQCTRWKGGCGSCPALNAYPPALVDRSAQVHRSRRALLGQLTRPGRGSWVACAGWLARDFADLGLGECATVQNAVDAGFWESAMAARREKPKLHDKTKKVLFVVRDLRDSAKIDWQLLRAMASKPGIELTIVGDNSPESVAGAIMRPSTSNRAELAALMSQNDKLLFTSRVDYYPLTVAEAIVSGMQVIARDSPASREFTRFGVVSTYNSVSEAIYAAGEESAEPSDVEFLHPGRMAREYHDIYMRAVG